MPASHTSAHAHDAASGATAAAAAVAPALPAWLDVRAAARSEAFTGADLLAPPRTRVRLTPAWLSLIFGDGSPTRTLSLATRAPLRVALLGTDALAEGDGERSGGGGGEGDSSGGGSGGGSGGAFGGDAEDAFDDIDGVTGAPARAVRALRGPRVRRRVWLCAADGPRLGYAVSWWSAADAAAVLADAAAPIGTALAAARLEARRELLLVTRGEGHAALDAALGNARGGALWARWYAIVARGEPLCVVHEVFAPALEAWLGAMEE
jgi:chorismate-pyruvate lyase